MNLTIPYGAQLYAPGAQTSTVTSSTITLPLCASYLFILDVTAVSGTTPTLDVAIQVTHDDGTTFYSIIRFAQVTSASKLAIRVQASMGLGEAGSAITIADTGGALNSNVNLSQKIKIKYTIGGTTPSFTAAVNVIAIPRGAMISL